MALGEAQHHAGDAAHRPTLVEAAGLALEFGDGPLAARALLANQRPVTVLQSVDHERLALLELVLAALGTGDTGDRARVLVAIASELHHSTDPRRHEFAREAVAVARRLDDPACLGRVLAVAGFALWNPDTLAERVEIATELSGLADQSGDPVLEIDAGLALYYATATDGDFDRAREALATATRAAGELGQPAFRLRGLLAQQSSAMLDGRFADFNRFAAEALHLGEALGNPDAGAIHQADGAIMRLLSGRVVEALEGMAAAADVMPPCLLNPFRAWAQAEAGRLSEAAALVAAIGGAALRDIPRNYVRLGVLTALAGACGPLGDQELARTLRHELLPCRNQWALAQVSALGPVAHYLGVLAAVLGDTDEADGHFACAAELAERTRARGVLVRTRLEWARCLLERGGPGDGERGRDLATAARELAHEIDSPQLAERASELLVGSTVM